MPRVGVRELKNRTSEILRAVREEGARYIVTYQGRPSAVLLPVDEGELEDYVLTHHSRFAERQKQARQIVRQGETGVPGALPFSPTIQVMPQAADAQAVAERITRLATSSPALETAYVWIRPWGFECWLVANQSTEEERFHLYDVEWELMEQFPDWGFKFNLVDREDKPLSEAMSVEGVDAVAQRSVSPNA